MEQFSQDYIREFRTIIDNKDKDRALELLNELHPADIAALYQELDLDEAEFVYLLLDADKAADVIKPKHFIPMHMKPGMDFVMSQAMKVRSPYAMLMRPGNEIVLEK